MIIEFEYRARTYLIEPVSEIDHIGSGKDQ